MTVDLPRAYSINQPDFEHEVGRRLEVVVDGEVKDLVVEYDVDRGYVLFLVPDENGRAQLNEAKDGVLRDWVYGAKVEVSWAAAS